MLYLRSHMDGKQGVSDEMFPKWVFDCHQQGLVESGDFQETNSSGESVLGSQGFTYHWDNQSVSGRLSL